MPRIFLSHSSKDRLRQPSLVDPLVELLRSHYLDTWFSPRDIPAGLWEQSIGDGLRESDWFVVVLTPNALASEWVRREVEMAFADPKYYDPTRGHCRIVPVLVEPCDWQTLHPELERCQLFDLGHNPEETRVRLLLTWQVERHAFPQYRVGSVLVPVYIFVGGDGSTRYGPGAILGNVPEGDYEPAEDIRVIAGGPEGLLARKQAESERNEQVFVDNRQIRLNAASWGQTGPGGGLSNRPLRLYLGWTRYYHTFVTNMNTDARLADGLTVGLKYQSALDDLAGSCLSNPFAVNLSLVTSDGWIYVAQRSRHVAWNRGGFQPAVSGDGQPEDLDGDGRYDPFRTGIRETTEEATGLYVPKPEEITFFGLARTFKTRFPFLFGEVRVGLTHEELESQRPTMGWEGRLLGMPFTVEAVTDWIRERYLDQLNRRLTGAVGTTLFALLQSLLYAYPDRWLEVVRRLTITEGKTP